MNSIDLEFFTPGKAKPPLKDRSMQILFVGNLTRRKGADLLAPILDALGDGYTLNYTASRDGDFAPLLRHPHAHCLGRLSLEGVRDAYRKADILLLPTRLEGLPRAAMESIACGTPVVSSDASSLPEIVTDGETGYVCREDDVNAFAVTIRNLKNNPSKLIEMSLKSRKYAEKKLDLKRMAQHFVLLTQQLSTSYGAKEIPEDR